MMFPIDAKAHAMRVPVPRDAVREMEVPRGSVVPRRVSNKQPRLLDINRRRTQPKASRTVRPCRGDFTRARIEVRETKVVDQLGTQHTRQSQQTLVGPRQLARPLRGIGEKKRCRVGCALARCKGPPALV